MNQFFFKTIRANLKKKKNLVLKVHGASELTQHIFRVVSKPETSSTRLHLEWILTF